MAHDARLEVIDSLHSILSQRQPSSADGDYYSYHRTSTVLLLAESFAPLDLLLFSSFSCCSLPNNHGAVYHLQLPFKAVYMTAPRANHSSLYRRPSALAMTFLTLSFLLMAEIFRF